MRTYLYAIRRLSDGTVLVLDIINKRLSSAYDSVLYDLIESGGCIVKNYDIQSGMLNRQIKMTDSLVILKHNKRYIVCKLKPYGIIHNNGIDFEKDCCDYIEVSGKDIAANINEYHDVRRCGSGIVVKNGDIPEANKYIISKMKMDNFNKKVEMVFGATPLRYEVNNNGDICVTGMFNYQHCKHETIIIPDIVTEISNRAFVRADIKSVIIGKGIKEIPAACFYGCTKLESVRLGENVDTISNRAFKNCKRLSKVEFNSKLTTILSEAFLNTDMKCVKLDSKVKYIGKAAFDTKSTKYLDLSNTLINEIYIQGNKKDIDSLKVPKNCKVEFIIR